MVVGFGGGTASIGGFGGRGGCGCRSLGTGGLSFGGRALEISTGLGPRSGLATAVASAAGAGATAATLGFFRGRGRRGGFGMTAFIERLMRFIPESTPIT